MEYYPPRATPGDDRAGRRVIFLPGASGDGGFWRPVAKRLRYPGEVVRLDWPGLGAVPPRPDVVGFTDLVRMTTALMDRPVDLVAQSMGGVALHVVRHLLADRPSDRAGVSWARREFWAIGRSREAPNRRSAPPQGESEEAAGLLQRG